MRDLIEAINTDWHAPFKARLERLANKAYKDQLRAWEKSGRKKSTFRYAPPEWQIAAIDALDKNDENAAKYALLNVE